jgi:hypothetical protein
MKEHLKILILGVSLAVGMPLSAVAAQKLVSVEANAGPVTAAQRGAMARAYVLKWGPYVQAVYKVPVGVWAKRMVPTFAGADASNFRRALQRTTYEGASAELSGVGRKLSDEQVIDTMARASLAPRVTQSQMAAAKLGDAAADLVYTPITPCRILDTRVAGGAIASNASRDFNAVVGSGGNFSSQGGSGVTRPLASSVNYTPGAIVSNMLVTRLPSPLTTKDFTIYTFAASDFVADIVGFYSPPQATALDCATVSGTPTNVNAGAYASLPTLFCAANYTPVALSISAGENVLVADSYTAGNAGQIFVRSLSANAQNVTAKLMCCRVPGR